MFNKRQMRLLTRFAERNQHAPEAKPGTVCKWAVVPYVDGDRGEVDRVFILRHRAEEYVSECYAKAEVEATNEVELRIEPIYGR
jgi:hypothetical protein